MVRWLTPLVVLVALVPDASAQGRLARARTEMDGRPHGPPTPPPPDDRPIRPISLPEFESFDELLGAAAVTTVLAGVVVSSPVWVPYALFDNLKGDACFPEHPYAFTRRGYLVGPKAVPEDETQRRWGARLGLEVGDDFVGLNRVGFRSALDTSERIGLYTSWDVYTERLPGGGRDGATLGSVMATLCFVQSAPVQMHLGVGGQGWFDGRPRGGVCCLYGADIYPADPIVLAAQAEAGHLNDAFTLRLRATAGVQLRHAELFVGYDWLKVGGVALHGSMAGLRLTF